MGDKSWWSQYYYQLIEVFYWFCLVDILVGKEIDPANFGQAGIAALVMLYFFS